MLSEDRTEVSRLFEYVAKFKYLGTALTHKNCMHKEIKSRLNLGNIFTVNCIMDSRMAFSNTTLTTQ
jgi:hypothetical protein